jgi:hypothetical protein
LFIVSSFSQRFEIDKFKKTILFLSVDGKAVVARDSLKDVAENCLRRINNLVAAAQRRGLQPRGVYLIMLYIFAIL